MALQQFKGWLMNTLIKSKNHNYRRGSKSVEFQGEKIAREEAMKAL